MKCPICGNELKYCDYYGTNLHLDSFDNPKEGFKQEGEIYKCENEDCDSYAFNYYFHTDKQNNLKEGYPC